MFNKGQLAGLMKQAQAMQDNLKKAQEELALIEVTGESAQVKHCRALGAGADGLHIAGNGGAWLFNRSSGAQGSSTGPGTSIVATGVRPVPPDATVSAAVVPSGAAPCRRL